MRKRPSVYIKKEMVLIAISGASMASNMNSYRGSHTLLRTHRK